MRCLLLALLAFGPTVAAQPILDTTFGDGGVSGFVPDTDRQYARSGLISDGGEAVSFGSLQHDSRNIRSIGVVRLSEDGVRDEAFGDAGLADVRLGSREHPRAAAVMDDGRVAVVGSYVSNRYLDPFPHMIIARFLPDGTPDPLFNQGRMDYRFATFTYGMGVVPQGDALIVSVARSTDCVLARIAPNGDHDLSFGPGGFASPPGTGCFAKTPTLAGSADDLVALSYTSDPRTTTLHVTRYDGEGQRNAAFGDAGAVDLTLVDDSAADLSEAPEAHAKRAISLPFPRGLSITAFGETPDGGVYVAGTAAQGSDQVRFVTRLAADGSPVPGFGDAGTRWFPEDRHSTRPVPQAPRAVALDDGSLLLASTRVRDEAADILLYRLRTDGTLDPAFGPDGYASLRALSGSPLPFKATGVTALVLDASSRILVSGLSDTGETDGGAFVARLTLSEASVTSSGPEALTGSAVGMSVSPNPTRSRAVVLLSGIGSQPADVAVYDMLGRRVATLHDGPAAAGELRARWDASGVAPGAYVVVARVGHDVTARRVSVVH